MAQVTLEQVLAETGVKLDLLDKECAQDKVLSLAEYCDSLTVVGLALGLSEIQISDIDKDHRTTEEKRVALVQKWKQSSAFNATYKTFIQALLACGRAEQATEICRQLAVKENEDNSSVSNDEQPDLNLTSGPPPLVSSDEKSNLNLESTASPSNDQPCDVDNMQSVPKEQSLEASLQDKLDKLEHEYRVITINFDQSVKAVDLDMLQSYAASLPIRVRKCYDELQIESFQSKADNAKSTRKFVTILNNYSDFINPALLGDAIKMFGDEKTKSEMNAYNSKLQEFQVAAKLEHFVNVAWEGVTPEEYEEIELVLKSDWRKKTLKDISPPKRTWLFKKVFEGSLRVIFSIPDLKDLEEEDVREFLQRHVKQVFAKGRCILDFEMEESHDQPPLQTVSFRFSSFSHGKKAIASEDGLEADLCVNNFDFFYFPLQESHDQPPAHAISGQTAPEESETVKETFTSPDEIAFKFSSFSCGKNIIVSEDGLEARRRDVEDRYDGGAGVYIPTPLSGQVDFEIEITGYDSNGRRSMKIGVAQTPRGSYKHLDIPCHTKDYYCYWNGGKELTSNLSGDEVETSYGSVDLDDLECGDSVGVQVTSEGNLSFSFNGITQGIAARSIYREDRDTYLYVKVRGRTTAVRITRAAISGFEHPAESHRGQVDQPTLPSFKFRPYPHCEDEVTLLEDGLYARKVDPKLRNNDDAVVVGSVPIKHRGTLEVEIVEFNSELDDTIMIGVIRLPTGTEMKDTPEEPDNYCMWSENEVGNRLDGDLTESKYGSVNLDDLQQGDKVGMRLSSDGTLSFFINGKSQGVAARGLNEDGYDIYPVVAIYAKCSAVRITRAETLSVGEVLDLQELSIEKIASCLDWSSKDVNLLPLPQRLKNQIEHYIDCL